MILRASILFGLIFILFSCDNQRVYEDFYTTGTAGWHMDSIAKFDVLIENSELNFNLLISSRNLENYPYSNLWLFVNIVSPDSTLISDTVQFTLAQPNGKWTGKGTGGVYLNQFDYKSNVYFPENGLYKISIQQGMRDEALKGLKDIGLKVEKAE